MPNWLILTLVISFCATAFAKEPVVFDMRRQLAMKDGDEQIKDYYLNAGSADGIKAGMLVTVLRRQTLYDAYKNQSPGELMVEVGQLRIIHVQQNISVARLEELFSRDKLPVLDFEAIMVGDRVDLSSAKMAPRKTAAVESTAPSFQFELLATPMAMPNIEGTTDISSKTPSSAPVGASL